MCDPTALFGRRQNPDRAGWPARRRQHRELCPKKGIAQSLYYTWSKEFIEAGKRRLAGDAARAATTDELKDLRRESSALEERVADLTLKTVCAKKRRLCRPSRARLRS